MPLFTGTYHRYQVGFFEGFVLGFWGFFCLFWVFLQSVIYTQGFIYCEPRCIDLANSPIHMNLQATQIILREQGKKSGAREGET